MSDPFPQTRWSLVFDASGSQNDSRQRAFAELYEIYREPLAVYARHRGLAAEAAEDRLQAFFLHLLEGDALGRAERHVPFRAFLLTAFKSFLIDRHRAEHAQRRGGGAVEAVSRIERVADGERARPSGEAAADSPEAAYHRQWARAVLERAYARVRDHANRQGRGETVDALRDHLLGEGERGSYRGIAERLGTSEEAVRVAVHRLRARFRKALRREVADTVADPADVDDELRFLIAALG